MKKLLQQARDALAEYVRKMCINLGQEGNEEFEAIYYAGISAIEALDAKIIALED